MEIKGIKDLKIDYWSDTDYNIYREEPLLEYVWQVADEKCLVYVESGYSESSAPVNFINRYFESKLSMSERYNRFIKEMHPNINMSFGEYEDSRSDIKMVDTSFMDKYTSNVELHKTIKLFGLDVSKLWYLLLFVHDYIEDCTTDAPMPGQSFKEQLKKFCEQLKKAKTIKFDSRKGFTDEALVQFVKDAWAYYIDTYKKIIEQDIPEKEKMEMLKKIGLTYSEKLGLSEYIHEYIPIDRKAKHTLDIVYKRLMFAEMLLFFLKDKKGKRDRADGNNGSKDKYLFVSRLLYTIGYADEDYNKELVNGKLNRKLYSLLNKYKDKKLPQVMSRNYPW